MHRSYAVRYVKYELMVCHKTLCTSLTKEYDSLYTTKKKKKERSREENNHEQLVDFKAKN